MSQVRFIHHMVNLVLKEKEISTKEDKAMLHGTLAELEKRGVAICDLFISGESKHAAPYKKKLTKEALI
jgi:hypothetical protein